MGVSEAEKLIGAEEAEHNHGGGVGPERIEPKGGDKESLNQAMHDEINGGEVPSAGEVLCGPEKVNGEEFVPIKRQVVLEEEQRDVVQRRRTHEPQDHPARSFEQAINSFKRDSGAKALVKEPLAPSARLDCYDTGGMDGTLLWLSLSERVVDRV